MMNYQIPSHVVYRSIQDEVIILDTRAEGYLGLNHSAAAIWKAIASRGSSSDAVALLMSEYDVSQAQAEHDVRDFLNHLIEQGLIERGPAT
jgi:hypothetical protein